MKRTEIFINEFALNFGNYTDVNDLEKALDIFDEMLQMLKKLNKNVVLFANAENLYRILSENFEFIANPSLVTNLISKIDELNTWAENSKQDNQANYFYINFSTEKLERITGTTLAEITERFLLYQENTNFLIINFENLTYTTAENLSFLKQKFKEETLFITLTTLGSILKIKNWIKVYAEWQELISEKEVFEKIKNKFFENEKYLNFDWGNWQPNKDFPNNLLPFREISDVFTQDNWVDFQAEYKKNTTEKEAIISKMAKKVAIINGYVFDKRVSDLNKTSGKKREIYSAGESNHIIYLSVDFETGGFEVCNHTGEWQGEYSFSGKNTSDPKDKPKKIIIDHSIKIK